MRVGGALATASLSACGLTSEQPVHIGLEPTLYSTATSRSVGVSATPDPLDDRALTYSLELQSDGAAPVLGSGKVRGEVASSWHDKIGFNGEVRWGELVALELKGHSFDLRGPAEGGDFDFVEGALDGWEQNRVSDMTVGLGLLNDRLRFTSRRASSDYRLFGNYTKRHTTQHKRRDEEEGKERLLDKGNVQGTAVSHRLDAAIWRSGGLGLSAFGLYSEVDPDFESVESSSDDPFRKSNRETFEAGASLGFGPIELTLVRKLWHELDRADAPEESAYQAELGVDLHALTSQLDGAPGGLARAFAPTSAWVSAGRGSVEGARGSASPDDHTQDVSFGLTWTWPGSYANLDFWHSSYDERQPGPADYDWVGSGVYGGFGLGDDRWNLEVGLGLYRSEDQEQTIRTVDSGYDGSVSLAYRPETLPDVSSSLYLGRYETDYVAYDGASRTDAWEFRAVADFSKYLPGWTGGDQRLLQLMYRFEGETTQNSFAGPAERSDHTFALLFRLGIF